MRRALACYILFSLVIANISLALFKGWLYHHTSEDTSFIANDYPIELPIQFDVVAMTLLRSTEHFQMDLDNVSRSEWTTLSSHPFVVHLGANRRAFQVVLYHELHCVHVMEEAFIRGEYHRLNAHHIQHCENYLRQMFLCMADDSIEMGDFIDDLYSRDRYMGSKVCRDWVGVSEAVMGNLKEWLEWTSTKSA